MEIFLCAFDKEGRTISVDFLLMAKRDVAGAKRFFVKAMCDSGESEKVTMDKSGANKPAINNIKTDRKISIIVR